MQGIETPAAEGQDGYFRFKKNMDVRSTRETSPRPGRALPCVNMVKGVDAI
jgi:hypothetical protein